MCQCKKLAVWLPIVAAIAAMTFAGGASQAAELAKADAGLTSAGPIAFGPRATLFAGDPKAATVLAISTEDTGPPSAGGINVENLGEKIAALLGTKKDNIQLIDMAVNPESGAAYLSVARGRGPDAPGVLLRVGADGKLREVPLDKLQCEVAKIKNAPAEDAKDRRGRSQRAESITDIAYDNGRVVVAGLSNEEFASQFRSIPFPFGDDAEAASIEIYHGSHGRLETASPVRTFVPIVIDNEPHIVAAYTCTPLVKFPVADLKPDAKVTGTTVAELGNRNRPLDMISYKAGGAEYILMANSARGVMKIPTTGIDSIEGITDRIPDKAGLGYETVEELKGVVQLDRLSDTEALIVTEDEESKQLDLKTIPLP
jgi:hypothetical protein